MWIMKNRRIVLGTLQICFSLILYGGGEEKGGHNSETFYPLVKFRKENEYVYMCVYVIHTRTYIHTHCQWNTVLHTGGHIDTYTLSCVRYVTNRKLLWNTGRPAWSSVMTWRGGVGGGEAQEGGDIGIHIADTLGVQQKLTQHCKAIILQ